MSLAPFQVYEVHENAPRRMETVGSKKKFWFKRDEGSWLFKEGRQDQGEDWAEVLAAACAELLGLPHARYELANWRGVRGVVTRRITADDVDLVLGNELLAQRDPNYPAGHGSRFVRVREHTLDAVLAVAGAGGVGFPQDWTPPGGVVTPGDVFCGYVLLDAWIGNTDRHHQNWGLLVNPVQGTRQLAPTFDHASSLGAHELDETREQRLGSADKGYSIEAYVRRAESKFHRTPADKKPMTTLEAFQALSARAEPGRWLERLARASKDWMVEQIARIPRERMSGPARAFAQAMLEANRKRILEA